jgi:hypothetical protein
MNPLIDHTAPLSDFERALDNVNAYVDRLDPSDPHAPDVRKLAKSLVNAIRLVMSGVEYSKVMTATAAVKITGCSLHQCLLRRLGIEIARSVYNNTRGDSPRSFLESYDDLVAGLFVVHKKHSAIVMLGLTPM